MRVSGPLVYPSWPARLLRLRETSIALALVAMFALAAAIEPRFLTSGSIRSVLLWLPLVLIIAMGQMMVILTRGIDVSVGSTMGLAGMSVAILFRDYPGLNVYLGAAIGILTGGLLGAINGGLVVLCRVPPIVATLGTLGVYRGLTHIVSRGVQVEEYELPRALARWSINGPFGQTLAPWIVIAAVAVAVAMGLFLRWTRTGRDIYAVGGNPEAARLRGVRVGFVTWLAYTLCGMTAGLAGVFYASRFGIVNPGSIGVGFELVVISAVVVGGVSVFGGRGSVAGVMLGSALLATIYTALTILGIAAAWQATSYGLAILLAVVFDDLIARRTEARSIRTR
jgi:rhamnose transport system permease protein